MRVAAEKVLDDLKDGDSLAINGCCLTVCGIEGNEVSFDLLGETVNVTSIRQYSEGMEVNLERSLTPTTRMGGHFVTGHVDGVGESLCWRRLGRMSFSKCARRRSSWTI